MLALSRHTGINRHTGDCQALPGPPHWPAYAGGESEDKVAAKASSPAERRRWRLNRPWQAVGCCSTLEKSPFP